MAKRVREWWAAVAQALGAMVFGASVALEAMSVTGDLVIVGAIGAAVCIVAGFIEQVRLRRVIASLTGTATVIESLTQLAREGDALLAAIEPMVLFISGVQSERDRDRMQRREEQTAAVLAWEHRVERLIHERIPAFGADWDAAERDARPAVLRAIVKELRGDLRPVERALL